MSIYILQFVQKKSENKLCIHFKKEEEETIQIARIREMHSLYEGRAVERQTRNTKGNLNIIYVQRRNLSVAGRRCFARDFDMGDRFA